MAEALTLENVEGALITYLESLGSEEASTRIPNPRLPSFFRVQRTGGSMVNMIQERALVLIEAYSTSTFAAWELATKAWSSLQGRDELVVDGVELGDRSLSTPVNYPDPVTSQARYTFTLTTTVTLKETTP